MTLVATRLVSIFGLLISILPGDDISFSIQFVVGQRDFQGSWSEDVSLFGGQWLLSYGTTCTQGKSARSQCRIKITTRRCLLVSVLDGSSSSLNGLEQSPKEKKN